MTADRQAPTGPGVSHLVRRFVCGRCGATAPLSTRPYQECGSCNAVSDYDFGVARQHPDGPTHEALAAHLFAVHEDELGAASAAFDRGAYTSIYEGIIGTLIDQVPSFYPTRAKEPAYRACLARFHAG